jgi:EmrB/QacA subfamily drug resistance transporter
MARRWQVLLVTSTAVLMTFLDVTIVNIAFPDLRRSFANTTLAHLSWALNAYNIVFAAALVPAGKLADRFGRRRLFLAGTAGFLAASVVCGLAGSADILIGARAVQALGAALLVPASLGLLLPEFPPEQRTTATALWTATGAVAAATGPALGGVLVTWQSWRWVFFVNLLLGLPVLLWARRLLTEHREEHATGWPDLPGAALLSAAVAALALAITQGPSWGWRSQGVLGALAAATLLLPLVVARSARHPTPVLELSLFRLRRFSTANAALLVFALGFFALLLANVLFLTGAWHYSTVQAGIALTPGPLMAALFAPLGGRLADRFGHRAVALAGSLAFASGTLTLALATGSQPHYATRFLPAVLLVGTGVGLTIAALGSAAVLDLPSARLATGSAISASFRQIGAVLGIAALIAILDNAQPPHAVDAFHQAWTLIAVTGTAAGLIGLAMGPARHPQPSPTTAPKPPSTSSLAQRATHTP